jgi:hypothetical protein
MLDPSLDPDAPVAALLGRLVELLRAPTPAPTQVREVADAMAARLAQAGTVIEAGIENSWALDGDPLKGRLQARQVDTIKLAAGTTADELIVLSRALADDEEPLPSTGNVRVQLVPDPLPVAPSGQRPAILVAGEDGVVPRARPGDQLAAMIEGILVELDKAIRREQWHAVLHDAQAAIRAMPGLNEDIRRAYVIALKRFLSPKVRTTLIEQAYRVPEERARTAEVLRACGVLAAEQMLEILRQSETIGPRAFLLDALSGMPEALPLLIPLLKSGRPADARLAAIIMGRLGAPEVVPHLVAQASHPDERVRLAVLEALGRYRDKAAVEPLRAALAHESPATRVQAGRALAARGSAAIAMPLLAALEAERDPEAWESLLGALAAIDAPEAASALLGIVLGKPKLLERRSTLERRQLAVVRALAGAGTRRAREVLTRIADEGRGKVQEAARSALGK